MLSFVPDCPLKESCHGQALSDQVRTAHRAFSGSTVEATEYSQIRAGKA